jgi:hypothetical protein
VRLFHRLKGLAGEGAWRTSRSHLARNRPATHHTTHNGTLTLAPGAAQASGSRGAAPVSAAAYSASPIASGAVLPWPGCATAAAYTVITSRKVMHTSQPKISELVTPGAGPKQPGAMPPANSLVSRCRPGMRPV